MFTKKGNTGIWARKTKSSFEDCKVYDPDIEGQAVEPQIKLAMVWGNPKRSH